jgi:hypothetical protein
MEPITIISAGGIRGLRDRHAFIGWNRGAGELADDPTIGNMVVKDDGVTIAIALANAAKSAPDRRDTVRPQD